MSSTPKPRTKAPTAPTSLRPSTLRRVPRRRMFWRIYGFGALMIVVIAVSLIIVSWTFQRHPPNHGAPRRLAKLLVSEFGENPDSSATLRKRLKTIQQAFDMDVPSTAATVRWWRLEGTRPPSRSPRASLKSSWATIR